MSLNSRQRYSGVMKISCDKMVVITKYIVPGSHCIYPFRVHV